MVSYFPTSRRVKLIDQYAKFTDEEAISKDVGMKLKDVMDAYTAKMLADAKGKKRKMEVVDEDEDESLAVEDGEDDDDE